MSSEEKSLIENDEFLADVEEDIVDENTSEETTEDAAELKNEAFEDVDETVEDADNDLALMDVEGFDGYETPDYFESDSIEDNNTSDKKSKVVKKKDAASKKKDTASKKKSKHVNKEKVIGRILAVILIIAVIAGIFPLTAFGLRAMSAKQYENAYLITANQPFLAGETEFNVQELTGDAIEKLIYGERDTTMLDEIQEIYGESVDVSKFTRIGDYIKARYIEDSKVMVDSNGKNVVSAEYLYTQQQKYFIELDNMIQLVAGKDAVNDLYNRVVTEAFYTPNYEALKDETCFSFKEAIDRMVINEDLKKELNETYSLMYDIINVCYGSIIDMQDVNTTEELPDILSGYTGNFNFNELGEDALQFLWLASADTVTYNAYYNYYVTTEEDSAKIDAFISSGDNYYNKLLSFIDLIPITDVNTVAEYMESRLNKFVRNNFMKANADLTEYINNRLDYDYWLWVYMLGGSGALSENDIIYFTDSDRYSDYQVELAEVVGSDSPTSRYSWAYAHQLVLAYIVYLAGSDEIPMEQVVGAITEELVDEYAALYQALANDGMLRASCFSNYIETAAE